MREQEQLSADHGAARPADAWRLVLLFPVMPLADHRESAPSWRAIQTTKGDRTLAADLLGIGRTTLYRKLKSYGTVSGALQTALRDMACKIGSVLVALDATYLVDPHPSGISVYSRELLDGLAREHPDDSYLHYYPAKQFKRAAQPNFPQRSAPFAVCPPLPNYPPGGVRTSFMP